MSLPETKQLPDYEVKKMPLSQLNDNPRNPRVIKDTALKGLVSSIEEFGLIEPIIWNKRTGYIVGGHQRCKALKAAGYTEAQVLVVDYPEDKEMMANISLNNPRIQGEFINDLAANLLEGLEGAFPDLSRELMLHDLRIDLGGDASVDDQLSQGASIYSASDVIDNAFKHFRETGFPYQTLSKHVAMQQINRLASMPADEAIRSNMAYHVADTYNRHRYSGKVQSKKSLIDMFNDDAWLKIAIRKEYELAGSVPSGFFGMLALAHGAQLCANFRPGFAMYMYRKYGTPGGIVLDPCTGYGGRLVGWWASRLGGRYIGVDPSTETHTGNLLMTSDLGMQTVSLIRKPFEDSRYDIRDRLAEAGAQYVDFAFTSPPYFSKERYSDEETQSWKRYPDIDSWRDGFLLPLCEITEGFLKPGGVLAINIADVNIAGKRVALEDLTIQSAECSGLKLEQTLRFELSHGTGQSSEKFTSDEPVFIFRKPA